MTHTTRCIAALSVLLLGTASVNAAQFECTSPNGDVGLKVVVDQTVTWSVGYKNAPVIDVSDLGLMVNGRQLPGASPKLLNSETKTVCERVRPTVPTKAAELEHHARELTLTFEGSVSLQFRTFDTGVAYRFITNLPGDITIQDEVAQFRFVSNCNTLFPEEDTFISHYERNYKETRISEITASQMCSLPVLLLTDSKVYVAITDADFYDYPASFLAGTNGNALQAVFPKAVLRTEPNLDGPDRNERIVGEADYIAKTTGQRSFPWRGAMQVSNKSPLTISLAPGGGWAGILEQ